VPDTGLTFHLALFGVVVRARPLDIVNMQPHTTLGYHTVGSHHYFTVLGEGNTFLGKANELFLTRESFTGLVTAVHEHYHLMQEFLQGYSWWRQDAQDQFAALALEVANDREGEQPIPLFRPPDTSAKKVDIDRKNPHGSFAQAKWLELWNINRYATEARYTRLLLESEIRESPELARFVSHEAFELTTLDLMECHAAVLTELYVNSLIAEHPHKFHGPVVSDLAALFRVDKMLPTYLRPLRVLLHVCEAVGLRFALPEGNVHPIYANIRHAPLYLALAFLLDYALHVPPDPLELLKRFPDTATQQDIYPPFRFFDLAFLWAFEQVRLDPPQASRLRSEAHYYSDVSEFLAGSVNRMHGLVRGAGAPPTFFDLRTTTNMWRSKFDDTPLGSMFPLYDRVRRASWEYRSEHPDAWFRLDPLSFDTTVELPRVVVTPQGMAGFPYFVDHESKLTKETLAAALGEMARPHFEAMYTSRWEKRDDVPATMYPARFVEETLAREMLYRLADTILFRGKMRCPLTEGLGRFVPCQPRNRTCEKVRDFSSLPASGCALRTVGDHFGGIDRFKAQKQGWFSKLLEWGGREA
jgi:hypothetical protein